jgi:predicted MarR family transcription regulator
MLSSDLRGHQACAWYADIREGESFTHKIKRINLIKNNLEMKENNDY